MDEIIFRGSQKLENLQIQLALTAQHSQVLFQRYSERGLALAREAWSSPRIDQLQELARDILTWFIETTEKATKLIITHFDPRKFFDGFFRVLKNEISRQQFYCGCVGFVLGAIIGYSYAVCTQKSTIVLSQMKAGVCTDYGGTECATFIEDVAAPKVTEPDDVLVQVKASSVCNVDVEICKGYGRRIRRLLSRYNYHTKSEFPIILGRSCSGIVLEIGQNVKRFDIGDEVYLTAPYWMQGTTSEMTVAKEHRIGHKPNRIGFEGAAGLPYAGSQALLFMQTAGITQQNAVDKRILVCGACTPIGCVLIQYCHLLNADITATSSIRAAPVSKALGADDIIIFQEHMTTKSDLEVDQTKLFQKELELREPFDVIFITSDTGLSKESLMKQCKPDGVIIYALPKYLVADNYGFMTGTVYWSYIRIKCLLQNFFGWQRSCFGEMEIDHHHLDMLTELVDKNQLHSVVDKVFHSHDIDHALEHVESSDSIGSTIVTFR